MEATSFDPHASRATRFTHTAKPTLAKDGYWPTCDRRTWNGRSSTARSSQNLRALFQHSRHDPPAGVAFEFDDGTDLCNFDAIRAGRGRYDAGLPGALHHEMAVLLEHAQAELAR